MMRTGNCLRIGMACVVGGVVALGAVPTAFGQSAPDAGAPADASALADALMREDGAQVQALLQAGADVNGAQPDGTTALLWAVHQGDVALVEQLSAAGADVDQANRAGATPLGMAALYGYTDIIERLLAAGADASARGPAGETLLMRAARNGSPDAVRAFLAAGADVNAVEPLRGTTALMWAVEQGQVEAVQILLEAGADYAARSAEAGLPRNYMAQRVNTRTVEEAAERRQRALEAGRTYEEQLAWEQEQGLVQRGRGFGFGFGAAQAGRRRPAGAPAAAGSPNGQTPRNDSSDAADVVDTEIVIAGLVGGGGGGLTPLVFAAREGHLEVARELLDAGADVNETTNYGWTPLLTATNNRNYRLGQLLLERGADPNLVNEGGWSPLYLATDNRNIEGGDYPVPKPDMDHLAFIRLLLEAGADPNAPVSENTLSRTIFTMQWFFEGGATPFVRAAQSSDVALMKLLVEYGADPLATTDYGDTALTAAAGIGWVEGVTYERSDEANLEAIQYLVELGLDVNAANQDGRTPLMGAALKGRPAVVQFLVDSGARLDQHDHGSRDTDKVGSLLAGHTWQAVDYADGLVRVGVQSATARPETGALIRRLMQERGMPVPAPNRTIDSICLVPICGG